LWTHEFGGLLIILIASRTFFDIADLVNKPGGIVYGATYTDISARLPAMYVIMILGVFAGAATIANSFLTFLRLSLIEFQRIQIHIEF
jgi:uncharacterized membrane protein (UPF0182 family)